MALRVIEGCGITGVADLHRCAAALLERDDPGLLPDAFRFAWICDLSLQVRPGEPRLCGDWIYYDASRSWVDQQRDVARCVAEWALGHFDVPVTAFGVHHVANALLAPRSRCGLRVVAAS